MRNGIPASARLPMVREVEVRGRARLVRLAMSHQKAVSGSRI